MGTPEISNDEARLEVLWHLAEGLWYFFRDENGSDEEQAESLTMAQGIVLRLSQSMNLEVEQVLGEREFLLRVNLSEKAFEFMARGEQ